jgi:membrane associated rhomboid family serine protease
VRVKRIIVAVVGIAQGATGVLAGILACMLYFNFFDVQTTLKASTELLPFYLLALGVFGLFSIISALFLIREGLE